MALGVSLVFRPAVLGGILKFTELSALGLFPGNCAVLFSLSIIIICPGLDSRAWTALEHMLESVVSARGKVLRRNFSATSRVTRATKLTQAASRHSYRWCSPPTRGSATTFAVGDGRCVTVLKLGVLCLLFIHPRPLWCK